jgi:hypothetical protein
VKYYSPKEHESRFKDVHPSKRQHHVKPLNEPLYVVTAITNPTRYYSRYKLYQAFEQMVEAAGGILYTVELAFGDRHFEITSHKNPHHIQLRSRHQLWFKENLLNIAISRLPQDWGYVAWIDSDVSFARPDWVEECLHQLQHFDFIQMFTYAQDLSPKFEPIGRHRGLIWTWRNSGEPCDTFDDSDYYAVQKAHPGYAWAARRSALNSVGGLIDWAILGSADRHMAGALIGQVEHTYNQNVTQAYKDLCLEWQNRCERHIKRNVGYMDGLLLHYWHGPKRDRGYSSRWKILVEDKFDPRTDIKYDTNGVLQLTDNKWQLRDDIRRYFNQRNEDSIDL